MTARRAGTDSDHRVNMGVENYLTYESQKAPIGHPSFLHFNPSSRIGPSGATPLSSSRSDPPPGPPPNIRASGRVLAEL